MKVVVTGSRGWYHDGYRKIIRKRLCGLPTGSIVINGGCRGVDKLAEVEARKLGFSTVTVKAKWSKFGPAAGMIRNRQMLEEFQPDLVLAFHHDLENSAGTKNCVDEAIARGIAVERIKGPIPK
jgi:hypothetical protein